MEPATVTTWYRPCRPTSMRRPRLQAVVARQPAHHVRGGELQGAIQRTREFRLAADADQLLCCLNARPRGCGALAYFDTEFQVHGGLDAGAERLPVRLEGMPVANEQKGPAVVDREDNGGTFPDLVVVRLPP